MKKYTASITALLLVLLCSCEKEFPYVTGFDSTFEKNSTGLVIVSVADPSQNIVLDGSITLDEGTLEITLLDPDERVKYKSTFLPSSPQPVYIIVDAEPGFWALKYKSLEGTGSIDLHLYYH